MTYYVPDRVPNRCCGAAWVRFAFLVLLAVASGLSLHAQNPPAAGESILPADYIARLESLDRLVASCQAAVSRAGSAHATVSQSDCPSAMVGADVEVHLPSGDRAVRFGWLRALLDQAAGVGAKPLPPKPLANPSLHSAEGEEKPLTVAQHLENARRRLAEDRATAQAYLSGQAARPAGAAGGTNAGQQLAAILSGKDYKVLIAKPTLRQRFLEKLENWIERILGKLAQAGAQAKWLGITAEVAFIVLLCVALAWFLMRLERQGRLAVADGFAPGVGAASARDWQLWLEDARKAAGRHAWREAIHLLYWASISRLESSGMWPADRARTPREYLALLAPESQHLATLRALTRAFETTWYAGHAATQSDFQQAEELAGRLTGRSATAFAAGAGRAEGAGGL